MAYPHGVYNSEVDTSLTSPIQGSAGLQIIVGTAPIHLTKNPAAAVNAPVLCYSFAECQQAMGYSDDFKNFTLCQSMDACFRVFNVAPIILVNVLDPNNPAHTKENAAKDCSVSNSQAVYREDYVLLDTLVVQAGESTLERDSDYIAAHAKDGSVLITLLSEEAKGAAQLSVSSKSLNPAGITQADIVGGVDAQTGKETGLELIRQIYPKLGMVPGLLLAPGWSQFPVVAAALQAKTESINGVYNCTCLLDIPTEGEDGAAVYTQVKEAKEKLGATSNHAGALWPLVAVGDKVYYYSAMFAALQAYTDAQNSDVPENASNQDLRITATVLADGTPVVLDPQQANNVLNANGVITAINANGFKAWGNSTAAYPSTTDPKDRWLKVRRFFDWDGNNFIRTYLQKVDRPGNKRLIQSIVDSQNIVGNGYVARDYCAGYRVEFRSEENPVTNLLNGHLTVHTFLAPYIPAEFIENIREYDVDALQSALGGD